MSKLLVRGAAALLFSATPMAGHAAVVGFTAAVANTCILTVTTPGLLATAANGTQLSSQESGGADATLTVVSTGTTPTLSFGAPTLTGPAASTAGAVKEIGFSSTGGASQGFIGTTVNTVLGRLNDTFTVHGRVSNSAGFVTGAYSLSSVVTCQQ